MGSTSYITNLDGDVVQHIEYVPFGEVFLEERNNKWNTPYLFNAKELDEETGLYYYGARYYDPRVSLFYGVDPLVEETGTPYQYCYQNPVKFVDPDGMQARPSTRPGRYGTGRHMPRYRNGRQLYHYENGRPLSYQIVTSRTFSRRNTTRTGYREIANPVLPTYVENYSTPNPSGYTIQMTKNNRTAKVLALVGDGSDVLIQEFKRTFYTDLGPKEEISMEVGFSNYQKNFEFNLLENQYQSELSRKLSEVKYQEPVFEPGKWGTLGGGGSLTYQYEKEQALRKYFEERNKTLIQMGPSPRQILLDQMRKMAPQLEVQTTTNKPIVIPEFRSAN